MPYAAHRHPHNDGGKDADDRELLQSSDDEGAGKDVQADGVEEHEASLPAALPHWPKDMELGATGLQSQTKLIRYTPTVSLDMFLNLSLIMGEGFVVEVRGFVLRALQDPAHRCLNHELHALSALLGRCEDRDAAEIRIGTICSGIGTQEMVGDTFNMLWNSMQPDSPLKA